MHKRKEHLKIESQKINMRFRLAKINDKFYVIDYANARNIKTYLAFITSYKNTWNAWEISRKEVKEHFGEFRPRKKFSGAAVGATGGMIGSTYFYPMVESLPRIALSSSLRFLLFFGVLLVFAMVIYMLRATQLDNIWGLKNNVVIYSKSTHPMINIMLLLIYLLLFCGIIYTIFYAENINLINELILLLLTFIFIFINFIGQPTDNSIYVIEKTRESDTYE